jgi:hypothetical protein
MCDTTAFIVPIYTKHISYGKKMLLSRKHTDNEHIPLIFGCSTIEECNTLYDGALELGIENFSTVYIPCDHIGNKAIYKKYYLLQKCMTKYEYIACIDAETVFVKHIPVKKLKERANRPLLYGSIIESEINKQCASHFDTLLPECSRIYFWFSDLCVYRSTILHKFFDRFPSIDKLSEHYNNFEYIMYIYFILSSSNDTVIPEFIETNTGWSLENCSEEPLMNLYEQGDELPLWVCPETYGKMNLMFRTRFYLLYHLDR